MKHFEGDLDADQLVSDSPLARELSDLTARRRILELPAPPLPTHTRVITVSNQKGGVGKTTSTVNLAAALARFGARVLVIDLDPQGNASTALGVEHHGDTPSILDVLLDGADFREVIQQSPEEGELYCIPSNLHLAGAEVELALMSENREFILRGAMQRFLESSPRPFHYILIDCPPSLGLLTINAFAAAQEVLIPIQCEYYALEGVTQLVNTISLINQRLNPSLHISAVLLTMFDSRTRLAHEVAHDVRTHFPQQTLQAVIPRAVRVSEAPSFQQTVISHDTMSVGSISYLEAAYELATRGAPAASTQQGEH